MKLDQIADQTVQSLISIGRDSVPRELKTMEGSKIPYFIDNGKVISAPELIFNEHAATPPVLRQSVVVYDPASFVEYFSLFRDRNSRVFADETAQTVTAFLDYHASDPETLVPSPRWCKHKLTLNLRQSEEWKTWTATADKPFTQEQFVQFLEQHSLDIIEPAPARMREVASDLMGATEVQWGAAKRMSDGQTQYKYTESTNTSTSNGQVTVPDRFKLRIPVYIGAELVEVDAYLRIRIKDAKLIFWYTLYKPHEKLRDGFYAARAAVEQDLGITIINGGVA